ncbi:hypothetical protein GCM10010502_38670 [Kitasatospora aureofaciens]|uniref:Uncharacterized protein n=2 Tax=Kitasatospora aureofaciens TaxID=1894 RepID=A0A8H9HQB6_KITAU|nr:hypothetical protein GCM10010502_38670 [Kitasatospora aureofaciens]
MAATPVAFAQAAEPLRPPAGPAVDHIMETRTWAGLFAGAAVLMTGAALAPVAGAAGTPTAPHDPYTRTELFFGTERPDGGPAVTDQQFQQEAVGRVDEAVKASF